MLYITERKTKQTDLRDNTILHMVSLFVVAYPHEVAEFEEDNYQAFLAKAREDGHLIFEDIAPGSNELVEVDRTRKGFLIKCSFTERKEPVAPTVLGAGNANDDHTDAADGSVEA